MSDHDELTAARISDLCRQFESSQQQTAHLREELRRTLQDAPHSPDAVARNLRTISEAMVTRLYADTIGPPEQRGCAKMIEELLKAGTLSPKHAAFLHTVRAVGNVTVHGKADDGPLLPPLLHPREVLSVADFLVSVLKWYLARSPAVRTSVVISGSRTGQTEDWAPFCYQFGRALAKEGYSILATDAKGVGKLFFQGATEFLMEQGDPDVLKKCIVLPFGAATADRKDVNRQNLLRTADIAVFVGGGSGTAREHEILSSRGVPCIPVGASGGTAAVLWQAWREAQPADSPPGEDNLLGRLGRKGREVTEYVEDALRLIKSYQPTSGEPH